MVEAFIPFKEEHQRLMKIREPLAGEFQCVEKWGFKKMESSKDGIWSGKITYEEAFQKLLMSCLTFGWALRALMKKNWGSNSRKRFYSENWENAV